MCRYLLLALPCLNLLLLFVFMPRVLKCCGLKVAVPSLSLSFPLSLSLCLSLPLFTTLPFSPCLPFSLPQLYRPLDFRVSTRLPMVLNTVFVTMMYCSGQPLLLPFAAFSLTLFYWFEKYSVLRHFSKPPNMGEDLGKVRVCAWRAHARLVCVCAYVRCEAFFVVVSPCQLALGSPLRPVCICMTL